MKESFEIKETFTVKPSIIYNAWLNSKSHSEMTGGEAICSSCAGEKFTAWNGYIEGKNIRIVENKEIVQSWRTSDFEDSDENSEVIIRLKETAEGCELTLIHSNIPPGQSDYKQGWSDHYFTPMKEYFQ